MSDTDEDAVDVAARLEARADELQKGAPRSPAARGDAAEDVPLEDPATGETLRDLTAGAMWEVSSAKAGNGVDSLLDGSTATYWQSDGLQPHSITASFVARRRIRAVLLYLNYATDESYTPSLLSVRAGADWHSLCAVRKDVELHSPEGWVRVELMPPPPEGGDSDEDDGGAPKVSDELDVAAHMLQVVIHMNHQNGRDSHVRAVRIVGPERQVPDHAPNFTTARMRMYQSWRP